MRLHLMVVAATLSACRAADPPTMGQVAPSAVWPGDRVTVTGTHLDREDGVMLTLNDETQRVLWTEQSADKASFDVPADLRSGVWSVSLLADTSGQTRGWFEVWRASTEPACNKRYALRVQTERVERRVEVERIFDGRPPQTLAYEGSQLRNLEYTVDEQPPCRAIWLNTSDGHRLLLADSASDDLSTQARALAEALSIPLTEPAHAD